MSLFSDIEAISDLGKSFFSEPMEVQDLLEIDDWNRGKEKTKRESGIDHLFKIFSIKREEKKCDSKD